MTRVFAVSVLAVAAVCLASLSAQTQPIPRTADGKPNLSGIWQVVNSAVWDIQDHSAANGVPAGQGVVEGKELPYLPTALGITQPTLSFHMPGGRGLITPRKTDRKSQSRGR